jgi:cell division protein FtsX
VSKYFDQLVTAQRLERERLSDASRRDIQQADMIHKLAMQSQWARKRAAISLGCAIAGLVFGLLVMAAAIGGLR